jgi:galactokinase
MTGALTLALLSDERVAADVAGHAAGAHGGAHAGAHTGAHGGAHGGAHAGAAAATPTGTTAARLLRLLQRCTRALLAAGVARTAPLHAFAVPGRIEVLGKHTDYAGGRSLLAAAERGFVIVAAARPDDRVRIMDAGSGEAIMLDGAAAARSPSWARYPGCVLRRLDRNFPDARGGADSAFASDLPPAAGLSSSSALVVATFLALSAVRRAGASAAYRAHIRSTDELAGYLGAVENGLSYGALSGDAGVGTMGGSEDHTAILSARPGRLVQYGFAPVTFERAVPMPAGHLFVIGASGVRAEKTGAALRHYNQLAEQTQQLSALWRAATGDAAATLAAAVRSAPDAALRLRTLIAERAAAAAREPLLRRLSQFLAESEELVPGAAEALARGDTPGFAARVERSQRLAEHALGNQIPETLALVAAARALGATCASAFGAGFGGSVWALIREDDAPGFAAAWRAAYVARFPGRAAVCTFFTTRAGPPACPIVLPGHHAAGA